MMHRTILTLGLVGFCLSYAPAMAACEGYNNAMEALESAIEMTQADEMQAKYHAAQRRQAPDYYKLYRADNNGVRAAGYDSLEHFVSETKARTSSSRRVMPSVDHRL